MRHPYTPVFRDFLTSSMWATDPATRCVWIWFLLMADPEGFVVGTVPGVAQQAGVTLEQAKTAIALIESPDPYSSTPDFEGRRALKVERGWHIVNFVAYRERAKAEAEKARKRTWAQKKRAEQLPLPFPSESTEHADDARVYMSTGVDARSETVDAPKPKPKLLSSEGESPLPPVPFVAVGTGEPTPPALEALLFDAPVIPVRARYYDLDGLDETGLEDEAVIAGVSREWFRERLASARNLATIGGESGVRDQREWVRQQFGRWKTWEEQHRAKDAQRSAAQGPSSRFRPADVRVEPFEPEPQQRAFAERHGLDLGLLLKSVLDEHPQQTAGFSRRGLLGERLTVAANQKRHGHPVTGKLTNEEFAAWGPVPVGGSIEKGAA